MNPLKIALPNKGRLFEEVKSTLSDAGLEVRAASDRALTASLGGEFTALFVRAQDIPGFVADGAADAGITGWDCVSESGRVLESLLDLGFGRCRLVVAGRATGPATIEGVADGAAVATSFPNLAEAFFSARGKNVRVATMSGAAEVAPHLGIADLIVDLVSTGSTLRVNGLVELATVLESSARLVARPRAERSDHAVKALDELAVALESVVRARSQRYLMANAPRAKLDEIARVLPGLNGPTVVDLKDEVFVAVHAVVAERLVYRTIARLKELGCEGILVTRIERLTP
ncbi:MAG: ATP phosphoribosyltransferase [Polyangiaceae bacterium]